MFRKVLVPLDGSPFAERILPCLPAVVDPAEGLVLLLTVVEPQFGYGVMGESLIPIPTERESSEALEYLGKVSEGLREQGLAIQTLVAEGDPATEIAAAAAEHGADLIAISTRGFTGVRRSFLGSVADTLIHSASQPVLLLSGTMTPVEAFAPRRILVALDGTDESEKGLPLAAKFAKERGATLLLLRAVEVDGERDEPYGTPAEMVASPHEAADLYLRYVGHKLEEEGIPCEGMVVENGPARAIVERADAAAADLIVLTTHGRVGLERWMKGSVTDRVLQGSHRPMLVVNARR